MIKLAASRRTPIAGRPPASPLRAIRPSGAFSNIRKNLFLTLLNFNDPFELCHQHLIILGKKSPNHDSHMACWQIRLPTEAPAPLPSSSRKRLTQTFLPLNTRPFFFNSVCKYRPDEASQKRLLGYY